MATLSVFVPFDGRRADVVAVLESDGTADLFDISNRVTPGTVPSDTSDTGVSEAALETALAVADAFEMLILSDGLSSPLLNADGVQLGWEVEFRERGNDEDFDEDFTNYGDYDDYNDDDAFLIDLPR